ncbi:ATP-binding protein [Streptomyces sp. NPDC056500]|uniref:ATP-binding protein n=1 Tax=Streptomyces sp. NPDC056500 TaxID=3345840 RepID=UPI0036A3FAF1
MHKEQYDSLAESTFHRLPETVACARSWATQIYLAAGGQHADVAELLVSEVVTNAVMHGAGDTYRVVVTRDLAFEVWDASPTLPKPRRTDDDSIGGRGLYLLAECAPGYTVLVDEDLGGKAVRFKPNGW